MLKCQANITLKQIAIQSMPLDPCVLFSLLPVGQLACIPDKLAVQNTIFYCTFSLFFFLVK